MSQSKTFKLFELRSKFLNLKKYFADGWRRLIEMNRLLFTQLASNGFVIMELLFFLRFEKNVYKLSENYMKNISIFSAEHLLWCQV